MNKNNFLHHTLPGPCRCASSGQHDTLNAETAFGMGGARLLLRGSWGRVYWLGPPGMGQSYGDQTFQLGSSVSKQRWREDGPRGQGLSVSQDLWLQNNSG